MPDNENSRKIVLVEPDLSTRTQLEAELCAANYVVSAHAEGRAALDAVRETGATILIADWDTPGLSGLELCTTVRALGELQALKLMYVVLLNANPDKNLVVRGLEAGANEVLIKPYHTPELLARLNVGERILSLQEEVTHRQIEMHKINAEMALLNRRLERLAHTDGLTGLFNRRFVLERLREIWALAERSDHPLSVIVIDVDHFKRVNDTYGHQAGDEILCEVAAAMRRTTRRYDVCGRFGGEEFIILCPETGVNSAAVVAERVRQEVSRCRVEVEGRELAVRISAGVAGRSPACAAAETVVHVADTMLYAAKKSGRNRVWLTDEQGGSRCCTEALVEA